MNRQSEKITAIYCRLANYHSETDSAIIHDQMKQLSSYAKERSLKNPRFFCDRGFSGTTENRPAYQRMISEIEHGNVSNLVVLNISRLCRGFAAQHTLIETVLLPHKVTLHSVQNGQVLTPNDLNGESELFKALSLKGGRA